MRNVPVIPPLLALAFAAGCLEPIVLPVSDSGAAPPAADAGPDAGSASGRDGGVGGQDGGVDGNTPGPSDACSPVTCSAPPLGCQYAGGNVCGPCGELVCEGGIRDAGSSGAEDAAADAARDAQTAQDSGDSQPDPGDDAGAPQCGDDFPEFARGCGDSDDCVAVEHQLNCCGTRHVLGIRADLEAEFEAAERTCRERLPICDCAAQPTVADDGTTTNSARPARVSCDDGRCTSTFVNQSGGDAGDGCTPGDEDACRPGFSCCYPCGQPGCEFRCEPTCGEGAPGCIDGCLLRP